VKARAIESAPVHICSIWQEAMASLLPDGVGLRSRGREAARRAGL
jgi:hypothetical protein